MQGQFTGKNPAGKAPLEFLQALRPGGPWVLTGIVPDGSTVTITATNDDEALQFIGRHNGERNLYYATNPLRGPMTKKATKKDVLQ